MTRPALVEAVGPDAWTEEEREAFAADVAALEAGDAPCPVCETAAEDVDDWILCDGCGRVVCTGCTTTLLVGDTLCASCNCEGEA